MSLKKEFIRDGKRRIIGSVTTGYVGSFETIVRDEHEQHHSDARASDSTLPATNMAIWSRSTPPMPVS